MARPRVFVQSRQAFEVTEENIVGLATALGGTPYLCPTDPSRSFIDFGDGLIGHTGDFVLTNPTGVPAQTVKGSWADNPLHAEGWREVGEQ
jgi:hypothetical protein